MKTDITIPSINCPSTAKISCPTLSPPASKAAPVVAMLITRGIFCLVSAPPSIAIPRFALVFFTTTRNLPLRSLTTNEV